MSKREDFTKGSTVKLLSPLNVGGTTYSADKIYKPEDLPDEAFELGLVILDPMTSIKPETPPKRGAKPAPDTSTAS